MLTKHSAISLKEALEHVLRELDDVDGPGLRGLDAGHLRLLPTPQLGAIEQVALGTAVQERLKYSGVKSLLIIQNNERKKSIEFGTVVGLVTKSHNISRRYSSL